MKNKKMKIGIDVDEIVVEYIKTLSIYLEKTRGKKVLYGDIFNCNLEGPFEMTQQEVGDLIKEHTSEEIVVNLDLVEGSKESINLLRKIHELFFITSRHTRNEKATLLFFEKHFPGNDFKILFSGDAWENGNKSKFEICADNEVGVFIEDNPDYALACAQNDIKVFLMDKPWNQNCEHENIVRVKNWKEILEKLK